jgi:hypothetical protein
MTCATARQQLRSCASLGPGLVDLPLSELELDPADEITAEEFEAAWLESRRLDG